MYCRWTEVRCNYARSVKTSVWLAFLDACTSSWLRGTFIVLTVLLDRRMYRYMCATTLSSRSSRSWSFTSGWLPASSVGLDCLVETAGIFRVFWAPARLWPGCLPDQNRRSHAPYLRLLSVQVDAGNLSVQCVGTMEEFRLADFLDHGSRSSRYAPHRASFCPRSFTGMVFPLLGALTCARDMDAVYLVLPSMSLTPPQQHHSQLLTLTILPGTRRLSCKHDPVCMLSKIQLDGSLLRTFTVFHTESASPAHTEVFQLTSAGLDG